MKIKIIKKINNNKFSNIIKNNNVYYIFGINSINVNKETNKFVIYYDKYSLEFNFIEKKNIDYYFENSTLIWDILEENNTFIFLLEQKSIHPEKHECKFYKYYIKKENLELFKVDKIESIDLENHLISKIFKNYIMASKIEIDEEQPSYYWGKYLFQFQNDKKKFYTPIFDNIVNYKKDKGHILHFIEENQNINKYKWEFDDDGNCIYKKYFIIFSIRHKFENEPTKYYYNIYSAYSDNLIYFYYTKEINIDDNITNSKWYCYPEIFKQDKKYYVLLNQDDFGKEKNSLLGELFVNS
jgi:hypothetical protein